MQCGTARDIFSNPVSDHVADFVNHMNPLAVLTARDALAHGLATIAGPGQTTAQTPVREVMGQLRGDLRALTVLAGATPIAIVTREALLRRLLKPRGTIRD